MVGLLGHSCLVPIPLLYVPAMFVFVDIIFDYEHLLNTIIFNFKDKNKALFIMGIIQFNSMVY